MQKQILDVGHTQIGTTEKDGTTFRVYYGNYLMPPVGPRKIHPILRGDIYEKMLEEFLNSEEGQKYLRPTKEEIDEASTKVAELEERAQQKIDMQLQAAKKAKEEPQYTRKFISQIDDESSNDAEETEAAVEKPEKKKRKKEPDELTLTYKRQANILTIAVIFLVLVVAFQMLLNLYLFTRG